MNLKPCPFCGESGEEIRDYTYYIPGNIYIGIFYCCNCGGAMIDTDKSHCWLDRAELWNKRFCADGERKLQKAVTGVKLNPDGNWTAITKDDYDPIWD